MNGLPPDEEFPKGSREVIAQALPVYRNYDNYDLAKRFMDAALIIGHLRAAGFKLVKTDSRPIRTEGTR
jgi:hypothetical protein